MNLAPIKIEAVPFDNTVESPFSFTNRIASNDMNRLMSNDLGSAALRKRTMNALSEIASSAGKGYDEDGDTEVKTPNLVHSDASSKLATKKSTKRDLKTILKSGREKSEVLTKAEDDGPNSPDDLLLNNQS